MSRPTLNSLRRLFRTTLRTFRSRWTEVLVIVQPETVIAWHGMAPVFVSTGVGVPDRGAAGPRSPASLSPKGVRPAICEEFGVAAIPISGGLLFSRITAGRSSPSISSCPHRVTVAPVLTWFSAS